MLTPEQLEKIALKLQSLNRIDLGHQFEDFACVAILLKNVDGQSSIGFIKRAENPADNWSGQLAFPGGRKGPEDQDAAAAVMREVKEEIGVNLQTAQLLGCLHDVQARKKGGLMSFFLRPFVFQLQEEVSTQLDPEEVADFFWIPIEYLLDPNVHSSQEYAIRSAKIRLPGIIFPNGQHLWGLTYFILTDFIMLLKEAQIEKLKGHELNFWQKVPR